MKSKIKGLLALVLSVFTSLTWATTYSSLPSYTITSANYATLTSPVLMPETAVDSFTVTITYTDGNQRSDISQVKLIDPETDTQVAVDTHDGFSGGNKENNVYTLANIPATYAGKVLLVKSTVKCNQSGGFSTCDIQLSNGVTHTDYTDITEVIAINFGSDKQAINTAAEGDLGFVTADGVQGAQVALAKWNNAIGASSPFEYTITVAGAKTESTYSLTYSGPNSWNSKDENTFNTPIGDLTKGYLDVSNHGSGIPIISLAGMPATGYDVAVILSGDGDSFGAVTVNGKNYIGSNGTTIAGEASWGSRQSYDTLAEGQNVVFVTEQSAETLTVVGQATASNARASIAGLMVFFRKIPPVLNCIYTVTEEGGSWDVTPSTAKPCVATIAFGETTGKSVDLAAILSDVKSLKSLTITGTNGGTIANTDGVIAAGVNINTNVKIPSSFATPAVTTIGEGASAYFTGETTASAAPFPYSGDRHFETIKFTVQQMGSGIEDYTIAANEQMLFTTTNVRYIENLILDGGLLKTQGNGQAWLGGAANKCLTVKFGIADLTSVTTDNGSSAVLIGYSGNGHTLDIQGGLLDASNTSIVGWELNSKYRQSGGLVKTKGFRQNEDRITEMTLTGGTVELGAGGIPNLGMESATLGAATIRATADTTIAEALNVTGAATLQAVDGKTLTVSGEISGDGTIAIGGTGTTKTRADDGTYSDATVNATGTVYIGTNRPKIASIAEGATLQIALTDDEAQNGISWEVGESLTAEEVSRLTVVGATLDNITVTDGVLTASLASNLAASWENGVWSKTPVDGAPITITFSEGYTTCTFTNTENIELASLTIKGETAGEIVLGEYAVTVSEMSVEPAEVTIPVALFNSFDAQAYTVESGKTLKLTGDADVSKKVDVRGTLALAGSMNFTAGNYVYNGGKLEVLSGVSTFNTGDGRGFQDGSIVKIAKGATLKNGKADAPGYNNVTLDIAGTLEVTDGVRWSLGTTSSTTLHEGAVLKGTGENDGDHLYAFDYFAGATITVDGDAKIEGNIGAHNGGTITFDVTSGKTLTIEGAVKAGSLATSGAGTVKLAGANTQANTSIANVSKLVVTHATALGTGSITLEGALTFKDVEAALSNAITQTDPDNTTNPTGKIVIDNSTVTLKGANGDYKGLITINEGATLKAETRHYAPFGNGASIVNNGAIDVTNNGTGDCAISAAISGSGSLTVSAGTLILTGANTYNGATTIAEGAKVIANSDNSSTWDYVSNDDKVRELDITVNGELEIQSSGELYRGFAGAGKIVINANAMIGNTGDSGFTSGLSRFTGTLIVAAGNTLTLKTWGNQYDITLNALEVNGTVNGVPSGQGRKPVVIKTSTLSGSGTISGVNTFTLADGATLAGPVTVNGNVTVAGALTITHADEAGETVIACNNAADIVPSLPTAPTGLKYVVDGNTIKLAVAKVNVTIPAAPANTKWYDANGNVVEAGTIAVDPNTDVTLTLKADDGKVFADGSTSKDYTVNSGENGAEITTPDVTAATPVAQVGETKYQTLQAAVNAANAGATVTVIADIVTDGPITVNKKVTVNLGGKTIAATNDTEGNGVFYVVAGGDLTLEGEGTVNAFGLNDWCMAVWAKDGGKVTINGGTYTNVGATSEEDGAHFDLIYVRNGGSVEINGGTFICQTPRWTLNSRNDEPGTFVVKGGTFKDFNPAAVNTDDNVTTWCADGYTATEGEDGYWTVALIPVSNNVAKIGETEYETLQEALTAAGTTAGVEVTLIKDTTENITIPAGFNGTIDLGGKTLNGGVLAYFANENSADFIIENGNIYCETPVASEGNKGAILVKNISLKLVNVNLTTHYHGIRMHNGAYVEIDGGEYTVVHNKASTYRLLNVKAGAVKVLDGVFQKSGDYNGSESAAVIAVAGGARAEFLGGTIKSSTAWFGFEFYDGATISVSNICVEEQTLTGGTTTGSLLLTGGQYVTKPNDKFVAEGYEITGPVDGFYTVVEKPAIEPSGSIEVSATDAAAAAAKVEILIPEGVTDVDAATYATYFTKTATLNESTRKYTVTVALNPAVVTPEITAISFDENGNVTVALETELPGLYYAVRSAAAVDKVDTDEATVTTGLNAPAIGDAAFYRVLVDFAPIAASQPTSAE